MRRSAGKIRISCMRILPIVFFLFALTLSSAKNKVPEGMVFIPAGEFTMSSNDSADGPAHIVFLDAYYIDRYEVTNAEYGDFMKATGHKAPKHSSDSKYNQADHPVVGVSWHDAVAYAKWKGKRLPTEAEWEKAARGTDRRKYAWGDEWDAGKCNAEGTNDGYEHTAPVGCYSDGESPYGCYDMAGNVWEWCADWYGREYFETGNRRNPKGPAKGRSRALRGGSWRSDGKGVLCVSVKGMAPSFRHDSFGFRCAKDAD